MRGIVETGGRNRAGGRAAARDAVHLPGDGGARLPVHGGGELLRCKDFNARRIRRDSDVCLRGDGGGCGEGFRRVRLRNSGGGNAGGGGDGNLSRGEGPPWN